jgi:mRNA interferase MazF
MNGKTLLTTSYKAGDLVDVPFPFIDTKTTKRRPSLVLSTPDFQLMTGSCILAMVTSAERSRWENDLVLESWTLAGLRKPSVIRWKLFTLDETLILGRRGRLADPDLAAVRRSLTEIFSGWFLPPA